LAPSKVAAIGSAANCCNPKPLSRWDIETVLSVAVEQRLQPVALPASFSMG